MSNNILKRKYYHDRIAAGKCPQCGRMKDRPDRSHCAKCRKKARQRRCLRYNTRLSQGLCPECGGPRDLAGLQCSKCRAVNNLSQKNIPTKKKTEYQNAYLKSNRKKGLCPKCGGRRDDPRYIHCSKCRAAAESRYRRDPAGWKYRSITNGWIKAKPPKPLCQICRRGHIRCDECGKYMHLVHGADVCHASCICGNNKIFQREVLNVR